MPNVHILEALFDRLEPQHLIALSENMRSICSTCHGNFTLGTACSGTDLCVDLWKLVFDACASRFGDRLTVLHEYSCENVDYKQRFIEPPRSFRRPVAAMSLRVRSWHRGTPLGLVLGPIGPGARADGVNRWSAVPPWAPRVATWGPRGRAWATLGRFGGALGRLGRLGGLVGPGDISGRGGAAGGPNGLTVPGAVLDGRTVEFMRTRQPSDTVMHIVALGWSRTLFGVSGGRLEAIVSVLKS
eukprot:4237497-Pyramimonas_sp.AAC.1